MRVSEQHNVVSASWLRLHPPRLQLVLAIVSRLHFELLNEFLEARISFHILHGLLKPDGSVNRILLGLLYSDRSAFDTVLKLKLKIKHLSKELFMPDHIVAAPVDLSVEFKF